MIAGCNEIVVLIAAQPEGQSWSKAVRRRFLDHLKECEPCAREYAMMAAVCQATGMAETVAPSRLRPLSAGRWGGGRRRWTLGAVGTLAAAACVALLLVLPRGTIEQGLVNDMQVVFRPGRETLGDPGAQVDGFKVSLELRRNSYVILAVRDESGGIEEIQDESQEHVALPLAGSESIPRAGAYAMRDSLGRVRTHVIILACEAPVSDDAWFSRPREPAVSGPDLPANLERVRKQMAERFGCDVRVAPIPKSR